MKLILTIFFLFEFQIVYFIRTVILGIYTLFYLYI